MTPTAAPRCCTANASTGVGSSRGSTQRVEARGREYRRRVVGEVVRAVAGVVADDHARARLAASQPRGDARRRAPDDRAVHAVRAGAQGSAQPRRAEDERAAEPVGQFVTVVAVEQRASFGRCALVDVVGDPRLDLCAQRVGDRGHGWPPAVRSATSSIPKPAVVNGPPTRSSEGSGRSCSAGSRSANVSALSCGW